MMIQPTERESELWDLLDKTKDPEERKKSEKRFRRNSKIIRFDRD